MSLSRSSVQSTPKNPLSHWQVPVAPESLADAEQRPLNCQSREDRICSCGCWKAGSRHACGGKGEESAPRQPTWPQSIRSHCGNGATMSDRGVAREVVYRFPDPREQPRLPPVHDGAGGVTGDGATAGGVAGEGYRWTEALKQGDIPVRLTHCGVALEGGWTVRRAGTRRCAVFGTSVLSAVKSL